MERHCRIHGNYGFFLGSSGGCPGCKSDRADAKRNRERDRKQAELDRRRAREEADSARYQANLARERDREEARSRQRENDRRREERSFQALQRSDRQTPQAVDHGLRMELSRQMQVASVERERKEKIETERRAQEMQAVPVRRELQACVERELPPKAAQKLPEKTVLAQPTREVEALGQAVGIRRAKTAPVPASKSVVEKVLQPALLLAGLLTLGFLFPLSLKLWSSSASRYSFWEQVMVCEIAVVIFFAYFSIFHYKQLYD